MILRVSPNLSLKNTRQTHLENTQTGPIVCFWHHFGGKAWMSRHIGWRTLTCGLALVSSNGLERDIMSRSSRPQYNAGGKKDRGHEAICKPRWKTPIKEIRCQKPQLESHGICFFQKDRGMNRNDFVVSIYSKETAWFSVMSRRMGNW